MVFCILSSLFKTKIELKTSHIISNKHKIVGINPIKNIPSVKHVMVSLLQVSRLGNSAPQ